MYRVEWVQGLGRHGPRICVNNQYSNITQRRNGQLLK